ncbi:MAG TPA: glycosyltransferase family 39 protein [Terriglobales bacterium]|nr:glycosyltransferase family 39 protein [Terriglobales bacterium]
MAELRGRPRFRIIHRSAHRGGPVPRFALAPRPASSAVNSLLAFSLIFFAILIPHLPLLTLPYFWDEAGYYVPAARDLLLSASLIPHTTLSNAHPPLVMAWLALWWKLAGFAPLVTRCAMLIIAAAALAGVYRLAFDTANREVAIATTICTALFPPFFAQSTLAHLDMAAAALTIWGLIFYLERKTVACLVAFSLAALAKETAIIAPVVLVVWELAGHALEERTHRKLCAVPRSSSRESLLLLVPLVPLALWFALHWTRTGYVFGNPGFFQYNIAQTFHHLRALLAFPQRLWQLTGYLNMYLLTLAAGGAMFFPALTEAARREKGGELIDLGERLRQRISIPTQLVLFAVILAYLVTLSVIGGALLARYLLPVFPLWILLCISTLRRRIRMWYALVALIAVSFGLALVFPPPYRISPEDTLAYRDFIELHQAAALELQQARVTGPVLTAWPATDELRRPFLGYAAEPLATIAIDDFSAAELQEAAQHQDWQVAVIFSTKYEPPRGSLLDGIAWWRRVHERWFGYHQDLRPEAAAQLLHAHVVWSDARGPQWIAILARDSRPL